MTDNTDPLFSSSDDQSPSPDIDANPDKDFVSELVGEGKKFKDVQSLARSVLHKEMHIKDIERENAELRQIAHKGLTREEFYEAIKTLTPSPSTPSPQGAEQERNDISLEQVGSLVDQRVQEHLTVEKQKANLQYATAEAARRLGPSFQKVLRERAKELGEPEETLTQLAMSKPKVFLELMAPVTTETHVPGLPRSSVDSGKSSNQGSEVRNMSWYKKIKQTDPQRYKTLDAQMHKDAIALGEKFFQ